jgi:hypothetical protein
LESYSQVYSGFSDAVDLVVRAQEHELQGLVVALAAVRAGHDLVVALFSARRAVEVDDDKALFDRAGVKSPKISLELLDETVMTAVKDLQQTVVDEIKAANADGKITDAEKLKIKDAALTNVKSYLGAKGTRVLSGLIQKWLKAGVLEDGVKKRRKRHDTREPIIFLCRYLKRLTFLLGVI